MVSRFRATGNEPTDRPQQRWPPSAVRRFLKPRRPDPRLATGKKQRKSPLHEGSFVPTIVGDALAGTSRADSSKSAIGKTYEDRQPRDGPTAARCDRRRQDSTNDRLQNSIARELKRPSIARGPMVRIHSPSSGEVSCELNFFY